MTREAAPEQVSPEAVDGEAVVREGRFIPPRRRRGEAKRERLRAELRSRRAIGDAIVLNELLSPPVGLRDRRSMSP